VIVQDRRPDPVHDHARTTPTCSDLSRFANLQLKQIPLVLLVSIWSDSLLDHAGSCLCNFKEPTALVLDGCLEIVEVGSYGMSITNGWLIQRAYVLLE
jgi:hypothetical protein